MAINATLVGSVETTTTAASATTSSGTTAASGSTFVVWATSTDTAFAATPVTDSKSNTYTAIDSLTTDATFGIIGQLFYSQNGTGGASHTATVHNASAGLNSAFLIEITGGLTSGILDQHDTTANISAASPFVSASLTTTSANEVALAFMADNRNAAGSPTWGGSPSSFTLLGDLTSSSGISGGCAKLVLSSTGAVQSSFTAGTTGITRALTWIATFIAAAAAGSAVPKQIYVMP